MRGSQATDRLRAMRAPICTLSAFCAIVVACLAASSPASADVAVIAPGDGATVTAPASGSVDVQVSVTAPQACTDVFLRVGVPAGGNVVPTTALARFADSGSGTCAAAMPVPASGGTVWWQVVWPAGIVAPRSTLVQQTAPPAPTFKSPPTTATAGSSLKLRVEDASATVIHVVVSSSPPDAAGALVIDAQAPASGLAHDVTVAVPDRAGPFWVMPVRDACWKGDAIDCASTSRGAAVRIEAKLPDGRFSLRNQTSRSNSSAALLSHCAVPPCRLTVRATYDGRPAGSMDKTQSAKDAELTLKLTPRARARLRRELRRHDVRIKISGAALDRYGRRYSDSITVRYTTVRPGDHFPTTTDPFADERARVQDAVSREMERYDESFNLHEITCRRLGTGYWRCDFEGLTREDISGDGDGHIGTAYARWRNGIWDVTITDYHGT